MSANPGLVRTDQQELIPQLFSSEWIACSRGCVDISIDSVMTRGGKWSTRGVLFLTNLRLVFIATRVDASGLAAFDLPLAYIHRDRFNQPVFACNNLSGRCWPAVANGGPSGALPPHNFSLYFKEGGVGTFLPLYYRLLEWFRQPQQAPAHAQHASAPTLPQDVVATAFVDPSDPSKVYLTQPDQQEDQPRPEPPRSQASETPAAWQ